MSWRAYVLVGFLLFQTSSYAHVPLQEDSPRVVQLSSFPLAHQIDEFPIRPYVIPPFIDLQSHDFLRPFEGILKTFLDLSPKQKANVSMVICGVGKLAQNYFLPGSDIILGVGTVALTWALGDSFWHKLSGRQVLPYEIRDSF